MNQPEAKINAPAGDSATESPLPQTEQVESLSTPLVQIQSPDDEPENAAKSESGINGEKTPDELVPWGLQKFSDQSIILTTSFGMEGCALMDMCSKAIDKNKLPPLTVACIDTGFFFPETKQLRQKLIERYPNLKFATWETPVSIEQQRETYGDMLWKNNPNMCCNIRKVQPMRENIVNYNLWITALRRTQTKERSDIPVLGWDWKYELLKFCPLASWSRADVWHYIQENDVPFNQLHLQNYPSVSCFHCTKAVPGSSPDSEVRQGRWAGSDKEECGLHFSI
jgi:phosphoadenosine phosphosulfate reductase